MSHLSHGYLVKDDCVQVHNSVEKYHGHMLAAADGPAPLLSFIGVNSSTPAENIICILCPKLDSDQKTEVISSGEVDHQDEHNGKILYFQRTYFLLEKNVQTFASTHVLYLPLSHVRLFVDPVDCSPPGCSVYGDSPGKNTGVRGHALFQRIFPTQGSNPGLLYSRWILYI